MLVIPFEALNVRAPKPGDSWGLNICRNRALPNLKPSEKASQWVMTHGSYQRPSHFGDLVFE